MTIRYSTGVYHLLLGKNGAGDGGDGLRGQFANCCIDFYQGTQPTSADNPSGSTYLGQATLGGLPFVHGVVTNGLNFDAPVLATLGIPAGAQWILAVTASGIANWCRIKANPVDNDASSTTLKRIDMTVGINTGECRMSVVNLILGQTVTLNSCNIAGGGTV